MSVRQQADPDSLQLVRSGLATITDGRFPSREESATKQPLRPTSGLEAVNKTYDVNPGGRRLNRRTADFADAVGPRTAGSPPVTAVLTGAAADDKYVLEVTFGIVARQRLRLASSVAAG